MSLRCHRLITPGVRIFSKSFPLNNINIEFIQRKDLRMYLDRSGFWEVRTVKFTYTGYFKIETGNLFSSVLRFRDAVWKNTFRKHSFEIRSRKVA